jgi:hypothetical protein
MAYINQMAKGIDKRYGELRKNPASALCSTPLINPKASVAIRRKNPALRR